MTSSFIAAIFYRPFRNWQLVEERRYERDNDHILASVGALVGELSMVALTVLGLNR